MAALVFMLQCADGALYIGSARADDFDAVLADHMAGRDPNSFTHPRRPVALVWLDRYPDILQAWAAERRLKGWSDEDRRSLIGLYPPDARPRTGLLRRSIDFGWRRKSGPRR